MNIVFAMNSSVSITKLSYYIKCFLFFAECKKKTDCKDGQVCKDRRCVDKECPAGKELVDGKCVKPKPGTGVHVFLR